jgi:hypothetical protein
MPDDTTIFTIADRTFTMPPVVWQQEVWLRDHVFHGRNVLKEGELVEILSQHGPLFLAILLVEQGQEQYQKAEAGFDAVQALATWIGARIQPSALKEYIERFFAGNSPENLWLLVLPKGIVAELPINNGMMVGTG